jgi:hypothetical protein
MQRKIECLLRDFQFSTISDVCSRLLIPPALKEARITN